MKQKVNAFQIETFLCTTDKMFPVPLSRKQNLTAYAQKLYEKATLCVSCIGDEIVSLVAGYTEDLFDEWAYIAVVATLPKARNRGLASNLMKEFISICRKKKIKAVHLYTASDNISALNMYYSMGFEDLRITGELRKEDAHLIYYLEDN